MNRGYVKVWRKIVDSEIFADPHLLQLFIWCLMEATHKGISVPVRTGRGNTVTRLEPGQFIFGRHAAARSLKCPGSTIQGRMRKLERLGIIVTQPVTHYSIVTIQNWGIYQVAEVHTPSPNPSHIRHPSVTNKNEKKKIKTFVTPSIEDVTAYCRERGKGVDPQRWYDHYTANGWKVGRNPMRDWKAAVRTWERSGPLNGQARDTGTTSTRKVLGYDTTGRPLYAEPAEGAR